MRAMRLPGKSRPERILAAVAIYGLFYVLFMGGLALGSLPFVDGSADVSPKGPPAAADIDDTP